MANTEPQPAHAPGPRPLTRGTGLLLQIVGGALLLGGCCVCGTSGMWDPVMSRGEAVRAVETAAPLVADAGRLGAMLTVIFTTLGGLAMLVFGLGMQQDRPRAAPAATLSMLALLPVLIGGGVGLWTASGPWVLRLANAALVLVVAALTAMCVAAWREVRADPPPAGPTLLPPDADLDALKSEARGRMSR
jgi:hypothetical protein